MLARFAAARSIVDEATGLDLENRQVLFAHRPSVPYDVLSLDIGSTPNATVAGAAEYAIPVKPIDQFLERWTALSGRLLETTAPTRIAVVGGGAGGVELLLAVRHHVAKLRSGLGRDSAQLEYHLFTDSNEVLPTHNRTVRRVFERIPERTRRPGARRLRCCGGVAVAVAYGRRSGALDRRGAVDDPGRSGAMAGGVRARRRQRGFRACFRHLALHVTRPGVRRGRCCVSGGASASQVWRVRGASGSSARSQSAPGATWAVACELSSAAAVPQPDFDRRRVRRGVARSICARRGVAVEMEGLD